MPPSCWIDTEIEEVYHWGQRVCFLGHQIGYGGVQPEQAKVLAIQQMARPLTKKEVRAFLGITGYYRRFIQDYATIAQPLTDLTKKGIPIEYRGAPRVRKHSRS
jgi:hypothetical protein